MDPEKLSHEHGQLTGEPEMRRWWIMAGGVAVASAMIITRGVYRSIELVQGWDGYLITHEIYQVSSFLVEQCADRVLIRQNVLDGIPMVIAVAVFNVINPLWVLPKKEKWGSYY